MSLLDDAFLAYYLGNKSCLYLFISNWIILWFTIVVINLVCIFSFNNWDYALVHYLSDKISHVPFTSTNLG